MQPSFRLEFNGADITAQVRDRLIAIRLSDEAGITSDSLDLTLDDRDGALEIPPQGGEMRLWLGYASGTEAPLYMGAFRIDDVELSGPDRRMSVSGAAADMRSEFRSPKTRSWHRTTIGGIVEAIAAEHGLAPTVTPDLAALPVAHLDQTEESDAALLTRLAEKTGAVSKPADRRLLFVRESSGQLASGAAAPVLTLGPGDVTTWRARLSERGHYNAASGYWQAHGSGERRTVTVGAGTPCFQERTPYPSEAEARRALTATLARLRRGKVVVDLTLPGRPEVFAEADLTLSGFRPGVDGRFAIVRVEHALTGGGLITTVSAETVDTAEAAAE